MELLIVILNIGIQIICMKLLSVRSCVQIFMKVINPVGGGESLLSLYFPLFLCQRK